jgi:hypothetical protein
VQSERPSRRSSKYSLKYATIPVSRKTYAKLLELKEARRKKTWDELISELVDIYENFRRVSVVKVVCNDMRSSNASLPAWYRELRRRLLDEELVAQAFGFLKPKPDEPDIYVVDLKKCEEAGSEG